MRQIVDFIAGCKRGDSINEAILETIKRAVGCLSPETPHQQLCCLYCSPAGMQFATHFPWFFFRHSSLP